MPPRRWVVAFPISGASPSDLLGAPVSPGSPFNPLEIDVAEDSFQCKECNRSFTVKPEILARYAGWRPAICWPCKSKQKATAGPGSAAKGSAKSKAASRPKRAKRSTKRKSPEENLSREQVLERYTEGPFDGVFTDGACSGNPGPGGWGVVQVENDTILKELSGHDPDTTNNRMEMSALIAALEMLPADAETTIWSDSNLCVKTLNEWAAGWEKRGWKRKTGPVENLDLVQRAYRLFQTRPKVEIRWIKAHNGSRYNEYADCLATSYLRQE